MILAQPSTFALNYVSADGCLSPFFLWLAVFFMLSQELTKTLSVVQKGLEVEFLILKNISFEKILILEAACQANYSDDYSGSCSCYYTLLSIGENRRRILVATWYTFRLTSKWLWQLWQAIWKYLMWLKPRLFSCISRTTIVLDSPTSVAYFTY